MIKRLQTPEELAEIFSELPNNWIQWLTENCTNPKVYIIVEKAIGLVVAIDSVFPEGNYFTILFDGQDSINSIKELKKQAKIKGATSLMITILEETDKLTKLGFQKTSINMRMKI